MLKSWIWLRYSELLGCTSHQAAIQVAHRSSLHSGAQDLAHVPWQLWHGGCGIPAWVSCWRGAGIRPLAPNWEGRNAPGTRVGFKLPCLNLGFLRNHLYSVSISPQPCQKWFHRLNPRNLHCAWKWAKKRVICWAHSRGISGSLLL